LFGESFGHGLDFAPAFEADVKKKEPVPDYRSENHNGPEDKKQVIHNAG
jgi:hypothetical protein